MQPINVWPDLELTEEERKYCDYYATSEKGGVLRRSYLCTLVSTNLAGIQSVLSQQVTFSGRRIRIFGLTFSGNVEAWNLSIRGPSGTLYTEAPVSVPALANSQEDWTTVDAPIPEWTTLIGGNVVYLAKRGLYPVLWDPNIVLEGTDALIFTGSVGPSWITAAQGGDYRAVLNIAVHCWEFSNWPKSVPFVDPNGKTQKAQTRGVR